MKKKPHAFVPTYQRLYSEYRDAILTHALPPDTRIDSINELRDKHQVSRETAKIVLKMLAREGLVIQKPGKGTFVSPLGPIRKTWGVVLPFFSAGMEMLLLHLRYVASREGRTLTHVVDHNNWEEEVRAVGTMVRDRYEAVIVVPTLDETKTAGFYRRLTPAGTVITLLDHTMAGSYFTYCIQSYDLGVKRATDYLLARTRGALAFIKNDTWAGRNMVQESMAETFRGLAAAGRREALIVDNLHTVDLDFMKHHFVGGILCCDDLDSVRIVGRLKEWGYSFPEDVALVSYGNTDLARYFTPGITSVDAHAEEMAEQTARIIKAHQQGEDVRFLQFMVEPDVIVRGT